MCNAVARSTLQVLQLFKNESLSIQQAYEKLGASVAGLNLGTGTSLAGFIIAYTSTGALEETNGEYHLSARGNNIMQHVRDLASE